MILVGEVFGSFGSGVAIKGGSLIFLWDFELDKPRLEWRRGKRAL
jgi:hypothetical protein